VNPRLIVINGKTYKNADEMPPDVRQQYEEAMSALDANRNGLPDFMEGRFNLPGQTVNTAPVPAPRPRQTQPKPATSTIEPEPTGNWLVILASIAWVGLCLLAAAAGVWYFFLR